MGDELRNAALQQQRRRTIKALEIPNAAPSGQADDALVFAEVDDHDQAFAVLGCTNFSASHPVGISGFLQRFRFNFLQGCRFDSDHGESLHC
ncbi:hypothetical protein XaFJ1_GM000037 (plasmid) [Xanthomonas albilineans]|nr:hypothetical protein XaFJ1_GM000037 [Xanthomonas albilineans]